MIGSYSQVFTVSSDTPCRFSMALFPLKMRRATPPTFKRRGALGRGAREFRVERWDYEPLLLSQLNRHNHY